MSELVPIGHGPQAQLHSEPDPEAQNGTGIGTSTKLKVQQHKLMTSVVGDTIGRLQNELQKFLDYSYRYSLFNSYSFRGNYILGYSKDGHKVISSRCLLPV